MEAMERLGLSGYALSKALGTSEAVISNIRNGKNPPNILLVHDMLKKYEELDPEWLLIGRGGMFRRPHAGRTEDQPANQPTVFQALDGRLERMEHLIQRFIEAQMERNVLVDESVSDLEKQVSDLKRPGEVRKDRRRTE